MTKQITISGLKVSYDTFKAKTQDKGTLVFLHGWGGTKESWEANIARLSDSFDCVTLDFPGFGESQEPGKPWGVFDYANFLRQFIRSLKITNPVIIGKSFGGRVAIVYASQWPEEIEKLVLVSAAGIEEKPIRLRTQIWITSILGTIADLTPGIDRESLRRRLYKILGLKEEGRYKREVKKIVTNQDLRDQIARISTQTLIVWGENDNVLPLNIAKKLRAGIKNSRLEVIRGGDHWVHQKHAGEFNQLVIDFL